MKTKILLYGAGSSASYLWKKQIDLNRAEVMAVIESKKTKTSFYNINVIEASEIKNYKYDLIVVASSYVEAIRDELKKNLADVEKCIFTTDNHAFMAGNKETLQSFLHILLPDACKSMELLLTDASGYDIVELDNGLIFVGNRHDDILGEMIKTKKVFAQDELDTFFELAQTFYKADKKRQGYFFDCGCNILSSAIYALHKKSELKAVGFEPVKRTCRIAKANAVMNGMEKDIEVENLALSNKVSCAYMKTEQYASGGSYILSTSENTKMLEEVHTTTIDIWCKTHGIEAEQIKYLWIDTEGYEGYVVDGARQILKRGKIPMYLEFCVDRLKRSGSYELLLNVLSEVYDRFLVVYPNDRSGEKVSDIKPIKELCTMNDLDANIFLM